MTASIPSRHSAEWTPKFSRVEESFNVPTYFRRVTPSRHAHDWRGLGDAETGQLITQSTSYAGTAASTTAGILASMHIISGAAGALTAGIASAAVILAQVLVKVFSGCGQKCVLTSQAANEVADALGQNLAAYMSSGHTRSEQKAALQNFDNAWAQLVKYCGQASFGTAGQNCIADRQAGACKWKTDGHGGPAGSGDVCWNWFIGYRDPIANDPNVVDDPTDQTHQAVSQFWDSIGMSSGTSLAPLFIVGGLILLAVML